MKRPPIAPMSKKRRARLPEERKVREAVFERDGYRCQLAQVDGAGPCYGVLTPHHVLRASQGGGYTEANLLAACAMHNDRIEEDADFAAACEAAGFVIRPGG